VLGHEGWLGGRCCCRRGFLLELVDLMGCRVELVALRRRKNMNLLAYLLVGHFVIFRAAKKLRNEKMRA
jgi:hypothetical protein